MTPAFLYSIFFWWVSVSRQSEAALTDLPTTSRAQQQRMKTALQVFCQESQRKMEGKCDKNDAMELINDDVQDSFLSTPATLPASYVDLHMHKLVVVTEENFQERLRCCIDSNTPLDFIGCQVTLTNGAIRLKGKEQLEIHGGLIEGSIHSLFQIDGDKKNSPRRLTLKGVRLKHTKIHEDPREIGAAVFAMGSSIVVLDGCDISSLGGFAVWAKHRCSVSIENCKLHDVARTAVACFNSVQVTVQNTSVTNVGIHGVCGRGVAQMKLNHVELDNCQIRAIMVYQGASMTLEDCRVSNTMDPATPAVHAQGPSPQNLEEAAEETTTEERRKGGGNKVKCINGVTPNNKLGPDDYKLMIPTLSMTRCRVWNSAGPSLLIEGTVAQYLKENEILS